MRQFTGLFAFYKRLTCSRRLRRYLLFKSLHVFSKLTLALGHRSNWLGPQVDVDKGVVSLGDKINTKDDDVMRLSYR
ncbi:hypothetical protein ACQKEI_10345 [Psychrobacter namhaensis]|uniref:hypothetical protein n=1 Tax=Psychrobacter namhaensis TaxID=292734 RepID=UPI003D03FD9E